MGKADRVGAAGDGLRLVEGRIGDRQAIARGQIAVGILRTRLRRPREATEKLVFISCG